MPTESNPGTTPILLALPSLTPSLALEVLPYGLTIHRLFLQADGRTHDLVVGPELPTGHTEIKYTNTIVGRYSNRVPVKEHTLVSSRSSDIKSIFTPLSNESPSVSLHGGLEGFDEKIWEPIPFPPDAGQIVLFSQAEINTIAGEISTACFFSSFSEDGEQGFPGKLRVEVLVGLMQPKAAEKAVRGEWNMGSIVLVYRAKLVDSKKTVTPINLTQHWGFNLDASLDSDTAVKPAVASIKDHKLTIKASKTLELQPDGLATGSLTALDANSPYNFTSHPIIGSKIPESGYDLFYVFDRRKEPVPKSFDEAHLAKTDLIKSIISDENNKEDDVQVILEGGKSGIKLKFFSNQSGVQYYSNAFANGFGIKKKIHGGEGASEKKEGGGYEKGSAAFLEFHEPYPAFIHPELSPSRYDTLLTTGEIYNNFVKLDVEFKSLDF